MLLAATAVAAVSWLWAAAAGAETTPAPGLPVGEPEVAARGIDLVESAVSLDPVDGLVDQAAASVPDLEVEPLAPTAPVAASVPVEQIVASAASATGTVVEPLTPVLAPVVQPLAPLLAPVVEPLAPVLEPVAPVLDSLDPVVAPVVHPLDPVLAPVVDPLDPVPAPPVPPLDPAPGTPGSAGPGLRPASPATAERTAASDQRSALQPVAPTESVPALLRLGAGRTVDGPVVAPAVPLDGPAAEPPLGSAPAAPTPWPPMPPALPGSSIGGGAASSGAAGQLLLFLAVFGPVAGVGALMRGGVLGDLADRLLVRPVGPVLLPG
jgi:hypothetical protein